MGLPLRRRAPQGALAATVAIFRLRGPADASEAQRRQEWPSRARGERRDADGQPTAAPPSRLAALWGGGCVALFLHIAPTMPCGFQLAL